MRKVKETGFLNQSLALALDVMGQRYGTLPSQILGYNPRDGRGYLLNLSVMGIAAQRDEESGTVEGQIRAKQGSWPKEVKQELREQGLNYGHARN